MIKCAQMTVALANALRRIILSELPAVAPVAVTIHVNSSRIPNEILTHRLGFVIVSHAKAEQILRIDVTNSIDHQLIVTTDDIVCPDDTSIYEPYPSFPAVVCILQPGQRFKCTIRLGEGNGSVHSRFVRARACSYKKSAEGCLFCIEPNGPDDEQTIFASACGVLLRQLQQVETHLSAIDVRHGLAEQQH